LQKAPKRYSSKEFFKSDGKFCYEGHTGVLENGIIRNHQGFAGHTINKKIRGKNYPVTPALKTLKAKVIDCSVAGYVKTAMAALVECWEEKEAKEEDRVELASGNPQLLQSHASDGEDRRC